MRGDVIARQSSDKWQSHALSPKLNLEHSIFHPGAFSQRIQFF